MKRRAYIILCYFFLLITDSYAGPDLAAEITFKHLAGFTYEITLYRYLYLSDTANTNPVWIYFGDGNTQLVNRTGFVILNNKVKNIYTTDYTYVGNGFYPISYNNSSSYRAVINMPDPFNTPMYVESILKIDTLIGINNSPDFMALLVDSATINETFSYNQGVTDIDGDSLTYKLIVCKGDGGFDIIGYQFPDEVGSGANNNLTIDSFSGDLIWDSPKVAGMYNVAMFIEEWRNGIQISNITRDMLINVDSTITSIENSKYRNNEIIIYPNPAKNKIFIKGTFDAPALFELYDITGRKALEQTITGINSQVNINHLSNGFYIYKLNTEKAGSFTCPTSSFRRAGKIVKH